MDYNPGRWKREFSDINQNVQDDMEVFHSCSSSQDKDVATASGSGKLKCSLVVSLEQGGKVLETYFNWGSESIAACNLNSFILDDVKLGLRLKRSEQRNNIKDLKLMWQSAKKGSKTEIKVSSNYCQFNWTNLPKSPVQPRSRWERLILLLIVMVFCTGLFLSLYK